MCPASPSLVAVRTSLLDDAHEPRTCKTTDVPKIGSAPEEAMLEKEGHRALQLSQEPLQLQDRQQASLTSAKARWLTRSEHQPQCGAALFP